mgnify:CR=1 FL=1|jgi:hypothetical protein
MKLSIKLLFIMSSLLLVLISQAQSTPDQSENECFIGGSLYDNCNTTDADGDGVVTQADKDWMHMCGYFLAQVDNGTLANAEVPLDGCTKQERIIPRPHVVPEKEEKVAVEEPVVPVVPACSPLKGLAALGVTGPDPC